MNLFNVYNVVIISQVILALILIFKINTLLNIIYTMKNMIQKYQNVYINLYDFFKEVDARHLGAYSKDEQLHVFFDIIESALSDLQMLEDDENEKQKLNE